MDSIGRSQQGLLGLCGVLLLAGCASEPALHPYQVRAQDDRKAARLGWQAYYQYCAPHEGKPTYEPIRKDCDSLKETGPILERRASWYEQQYAIMLRNAELARPSGGNVLTAIGMGLTGMSAGYRGDFSPVMAPNAEGLWIRTPQGHLFGPEGQSYIRTPTGSYFGSDGFMLYNAGGSDW
jgi:hypothetical protein